MKTILLLLLLFCTTSFAATDINIPNSHVFYPDIVTQLNGVVSHHYIMCRIVIITDDKKNNSLVEFYEPMMRDTIIDLINQSNIETFKNKRSLSKLGDRLFEKVKTILIRENGYNVAKRLIIKNIIIEQSNKRI